MFYLDAKEVLPRENIIAIGSKVNLFDCNIVCALLCDDNDLKVLKLVSVR